MSKFAAIQMCSSANVEENLKQAEALIEEAAKKNAEFIVLPEMFAIMGKTPKDKVIVQEIYGEGIIQNFLMATAKKHNVWLVGGTIPLQTKNPNKVRAASLVYNNEGIAVSCYDKIHLFDVEVSQEEKHLESDTTEPGNHIAVIDTPFGKVGICVCYDLRFPELFRIMLNKGAEIFVLSAAFTYTTGLAHWETLLRARAIENLCYVVASNQHGTHASNFQTFGHSMIIDPWGTNLDILAEGNGVVVADIDLAYLHERRKKMPIKQHQKMFAQFK